MAKRLLQAAMVLLLLAALVLAGRAVLDRVGRTAIDAALAAVPGDARRVSFTDWAAVREQVGADLGDEPSREAVEQLITDTYASDLSAASAVDGAAGAMQEIFGFGPGTAQWEAYGQSESGASLVLAVPDGTDFDQLADNMRSAGYAEPEDDDGVWLGGVDLVAALDPTLSPVVQYVALLSDPGLVVTSESPEYIEDAADAAADGRGVADVDGVGDLADRLEGTVASVLWVEDFGCSDLAMARADDSDQARAAARIEELGGLSPLDGLAMGLTPSSSLRVVGHYEDADDAEADLEARAELAVGEAYGRSGSFSDDYDVTRARTVDSDVVLDLEPSREGVFALSNVFDGPVVFASC